MIRKTLMAKGETLQHWPSLVPSGRRKQTASGLTSITTMMERTRMQKGMAQWMRTIVQMARCQEGHVMARLAVGLSPHQNL